MPTINRPMKAENYDPHYARFPYLCTPKIDGIRFSVGPDELNTCSMKAIPNRNLQALHPRMFQGMEGEFQVGGTFNSTTRVVMAHNEPISDVTVYVFDFVDPNCPIHEYRQRVSEMRAVTAKMRKQLVGTVRTIIPLFPVLIKTAADLETYLADCLHVGHEGVMLRTPFGLYKQGRSTLSDQYLLRIKPYEDAEGMVVGVEPYERNDNESFTNETGQSRKSHAKDGKVQLDLLGSLVLRLADGKEVRCGSGFTDEQRKELWDNKPIGQLVKFKYQKHGSVSLPRSPIFLGFRHADDYIEES